MLINNVELSSLGITLYDRVLSTNTVKTTQEWLDGDIQPTFIRQQEGFKNMQLSFLLLTNSEEEAFMKISQLTRLLKRASIQFDDMDLIFDVTLEGKASENRLKNGNFVVTYNLKSDYAKGARETYTTDANAAHSFKLTVLYYRDGTTLLGQDVVTIRMNMFNDENVTFEQLGVDLNKYQPAYFNNGVVSNFNPSELNYENLKNLQTLLINYVPTKYNVEVKYYIDNGGGIYSDLVTATSSFTQMQVAKATTIGQLLDIKSYRPDGFLANIDFNAELTLENILAAAPISVFFVKVDQPREKDTTVIYERENDEGTTTEIIRALLHFKETDFVDGMTLSDIIQLNSHNPNSSYYLEGALVDVAADSLVTFDTLAAEYTVKYSRRVNTIFVEYYLGTYPDWYRLTALPIATTYKDAYASSFTLASIGVDYDKYKRATYNAGALYGTNTFDSYDSVLNAGVIQIYYVPIDYPIVVKYYKDSTTSEPIATENITINDLTFMSQPILSDIIAISQNRPEGYQFDQDASYKGEVSLAALTQASPIEIVYKEITEVKTKNIVIKYKQEQSSAYSVINTSLITITEADCVGGVRLKDIINLDAYRPDYYEAGIIDGASSTALVTFDELQAQYQVAYIASRYSTPIRYYVDSVSEQSWVGSNAISYRVIDFTVDTTLYDLGLDLNAYKPSYCGNGVLQYNGPINFSALRELEAINVVYPKTAEPDDPSGINYPHRFLFLQHNDLKGYESTHPSWTFPHSFINTGITVDDMSKLTVVMECKRVDENVPMHEVNAGYGYLFGSEDSYASYYMRFNNQTQYGSNLTGTNTYEAKAGGDTNKLALTEEAAVGFSMNTGIYASDRAGYSYATFTYTNNLQTEATPMRYPLYLFANNKMGSYADGIAGVGIYSCRIYYNNQLVRDMIPVQFFDKIGDQVAPENCLYDKVTQTFFTDGSGNAGFNIIDDDRYTDTDLSHKIGHFYVKYCKDGEPFQTATIWFRGDEFETEWNLYDKLLVEKYQPAYCDAGVIQNYDQIPAINFDNMNNYMFTVNYKTQSRTITVNYYKDSIADANLLHSDTLTLTERDFYQAPTFGDIVRLNKYLPDGYETNYTYTGRKVSFGQILENSPYNIVYTPTEDTTTYTTNIKYIKQVFGVRTYETIATETLTFRAAQLRDGEYIDYYINMNLKKPEKYYLDGTPFDWYTMDERISTPELLKPEYTVVYKPQDQTIDINYYVDSVAEENFIATTPWIITIKDFEPDTTFDIVDEIPNSYMNKFKPVHCNGGVFEEPEKVFNFDSLVAQGYINIIYAKIFEPDDPESLEYEPKVLYWGNLTNELYPYGGNYSQEHVEGGERQYQVFGALEVENDEGYYVLEEGDAFSNFNMKDHTYTGGRIPYIDLGYNVKDLSRLRVEVKYATTNEGVTSNTCPEAYQSYDYAYFLGYIGPQTPAFLGKNGHTYGKVERPTYTEFWSGNTDFSSSSAGGFGIRGRIPVGSGYVYTAGGPQSVDGQTWYSGSQSGTTNQAPADITEVKIGTVGMFRRGYYEYTDDNWNTLVMNNNYSTSLEYSKWPTGTNANCYFNNILPNIQLTDKSYVDNDNKHQGGYCSENLTALDGAMAMPFSMILDAYNGYSSVWTDFNSNTPITQIYDFSKDNNDFEGRPQVKGSISLFQTTNPKTGKVNIMPFRVTTAPDSGTGFGNTWWDHGTANPYSSNFSVKRVIEQLVITGTDENNNPIYEKKTTEINCKYAGFTVLVYPQPTGCAIWSLKIYDRDRLVRDLIPVAKNDKIYNYTAPANGLFDKVTEIFFTNSNQGGTYKWSEIGEGGAMKIGGGEQDKYFAERTIPANSVYPLRVMKDPLIEGKITLNYYDYNNKFIDNQWVNVPTWLHIHDTPLEDFLQFNDFKPDSFHLDGMIDLDKDLSWERMTLKEIAALGTANIYYKLKTFTKTVVYYQDNVRVASKDIFVSLKDIEEATTIEDLGIDKDLYYTEDFAHGEIKFDNSIIASDDLAKFIDAPSPIVVYRKLTKAEAPNKFYVSYYRGGAYDDERIQFNPSDPNYLTCNLDAVVLNRKGAIKYKNHYHSALYEDETFDYFIPYQVKVINKYAGIHKGPARKYPTLAMIIEADTYTIIEERNGWGRLKEYSKGWIDLAATEPMYGPGQNPDYDEPTDEVATIPFAEKIHITKLTIDRLWAYCPAQESWVKTEEISFDQAGKLYNGLGIQVIDLSTIDWTSVSSLNDLGIYPQLRRLHYHDMSTYSYTGEYTLAAFQDLHELEIVYPETIYNINCIYYKDKLDIDANELGRKAISFSISDWNPDWDTFIETSWKYDEAGAEIPPTLYRDTPILLNWAFYNIGKNDYKPVSGNDGIFIWNPRTWDINNEEFSFDEIVTCGTQKVLYPGCPVGLYKIFLGDKSAAWHGDDTEIIYFLPSDSGNSSTRNLWDVTIQGEIFRDNFIEAGNRVSYILPWNFKIQQSSHLQESGPLFTWGTGAHQPQLIGSKYLDFAYSVGNRYYGWVKLPVSQNEIYQLNFSAKRKTGNVNLKVSDFSRQNAKYYGNSYTPITSVLSENDFGTTYPHDYENSDFFHRNDVCYTNFDMEYNGKPISAYSIPYPRPRVGITRDILYYENFVLKRYWTPVAKGMFYYENNEEKQFSDNGFYDVINQVFQTRTGLEVFVAGDVNKQKVYNYFDDKEFGSTDVNYIVKMSSKQNAYDYPDVLSSPNNRIGSSDPSLRQGLIIPVTKVTSDAAHKIKGEWYGTCNEWFESKNATLDATLDSTKLTAISKTVLPLQKTKPYTIKGYLSPLSDTPISDCVYSAYTQKYIPDGDYYRLHSNEYNLIKVYFSYTLEDGSEMYFDGHSWIKKADTSAAVTTSNKNYVVTVDQMDYSSYPAIWHNNVGSIPPDINTLKLGSYYRGDRVTILYTSDVLPNWGYTGQGWVEISPNLSEIS